VCQGPNSSGRSRQGEPVLKIHRIPFTITRGSRGGRPVAAGSGKTSAISSHSSSESSNRAMSCPPWPSGIPRILAELHKLGKSTFKTKPRCNQCWVDRETCHPKPSNHHHCMRRYCQELCFGIRRRPAFLH